MSDVVDPRFAPPQAHVADIVLEGSELAGRGRRLLAALIDGLIMAFGVWIVGMVPAVQSLMHANLQRMSLTSWNPLSIVTALGLFLVIQSWPLLTRGQTLGKIVCGLRIVRSDGSKVDAWRMIGLRYGIGFLLNVNVLVSSVYGLLDALLIFRASRQCLHDSIADTRVIKF